jgi:hypothetical protein
MVCCNARSLSGTLIFFRIIFNLNQNYFFYKNSFQTNKQKILVVLSFRDLAPISLKNYTFPYWTHILGELITASTLSGVVFWAIYAVIDAIFINKKVFLYFSFHFLLFVCFC